LLARSWGLQYSILLETSTGYHLGVASRVPIELEHAMRGPPFHHGYVLVRVGGVRLCVTHLSPFSAAHRLREAHALLALERAASPRRGFVLVGDLNSLSPLDAAEHAASGLLATLSADAGLTRKFLVSTPAPVVGTAADASSEAATPAATPAGGGGMMAALFGGGGGDEVRGVPAPPNPTFEIDYAPLEAFLDSGFVDAGYITSVSAASADAVSAQHDAEAVSGAEAAAAGRAQAAAAGGAGGRPGPGLHNHSVPTLVNTDVMHAAQMRLDYALLSPALARRCSVRSWLARDEQTERLSDHYPLLTELDCDDW
jgi:endonuclease/exonuclease/phosphatase family metal-dependent hydrolase